MFTTHPRHNPTQSRHAGRGRRALPAWIFAAATVFLLSSLAATAGPIGFGKTEVPRYYGQVATHRALVGAVDVHGLPGLPNQCWDSPVTLRGVTGVQDRVSALHRARHRVAVCAGEAAPAGWWTPGAISPPPRPWGPSFAGVRGKVRHPGPWNHDDYFAQVLAVRYWGAAPFKVWGYTFASAGVHDPDNCTATGGMMQAANVVPPPPYQSESYGTFVLVHDGGTNTFGLSVAVQGIAREQVVDATLCVGPPGVVGMPFFSLGPGMMWEAYDSTSIGRVVTDLFFPPDLVPALQEGNIYLSVCTFENPMGEIRGQIEALELEGEPTGDMDCDGDVDFFDIDPLVLAFSGPTAYNTVYPDCDWIRADCNHDERVDFFDIDPFVALLGQ